MKGRAGDRKRSPANRTLFGPVDHNQNKLDVNRIWTRLNERARTRVVDPNTDEDLGGSGTRGELTGVGSTDAEEGGVDDVRTRTREVSPSSELLGIGPGAGGQEFVLRSGTSDDGCRRERGPQSSAEKSLISRRLVGSKPTCVTMLPDTSSSPSSSSPSSSSSSITTATRTSSATTSLLKSSDCPWREPVKQRRSNEASPLQRPSVRSPDVERWRGALQRRPLPPPAEETEFRRIPVVQLVAGGDGVCPQEAQREKRFFKPIRASTARRSPEDDDDEEEEGGSRDGDGLPATEMTPNRKRKKEGGDDDDDDDDDDSDDDDDDDGGGGASCRVQSAVKSRSELFGEPGIKSETLSRRLNEFANKNKRTFEDADDDKTPL